MQSCVGDFCSLRAGRMGAEHDRAADSQALDPIFDRISDRIFGRARSRTVRVNHHRVSHHIVRARGRTICSASTG
ncbi:MAG: hypothetical protein ACRD27_05970 [Terracidiphilus sp.]